MTLDDRTPDLLPKRRPTSRSSAAWDLSFMCGAAVLGIWRFMGWTLTPRQGLELIAITISATRAVLWVLL